MEEETLETRRAAFKRPGRDRHSGQTLSQAGPSWLPGHRGIAAAAEGRRLSALIRSGPTEQGLLLTHSFAHVNRFCLLLQTLKDTPSVGLSASPADDLGWGAATPWTSPLNFSQGTKAASGKSECPDQPGGRNGKRTRSAGARGREDQVFSALLWGRVAGRGQEGEPPAAHLLVFLTWAPVWAHGRTDHGAHRLDVEQQGSQCSLTVTPNTGLDERRGRPRPSRASGVLQGSQSSPAPLERPQSPSPRPEGSAVTSAGGSPEQGGTTCTSHLGPSARHRTCQVTQGLPLAVQATGLPRWRWW